MRSIIILLTKLLLIAFFLSIPLFGQENKQLLEVNSEIGPQIDIEENKLYQLFPTIPNFQKAEFYLLKDLKYKVEITEQKTAGELYRSDYEIENPTLYFGEIQKKTFEEPGSLPLIISCLSSAVFTWMFFSDIKFMNTAYDEYQKANTISSASDKWNEVESYKSTRNRDGILWLVSLGISTYLYFDYRNDMKLWEKELKSMPRLYFNISQKEKTISSAIMLKYNF